MKDAKRSTKVVFYIFDKILIVLLFMGVNYYVEKEKYLDSIYREDADKAMKQYEKLWSLIVKYESIKEQNIQYKKEYYICPEKKKELLKKVEANEKSADYVLGEYHQCSKESMNYLDVNIIGRMNLYVQLLDPYYDIENSFFEDDMSEVQRKSTATLFTNMKKVLEELKAPLKQTNIRMYINSLYKL
ncbi:hypothetical protein [Sulfuricurvum sp.]|uniref:hypothetical protein n=1 Tax=Sulfuricurvum sp. TaxID=2025608 RepID=UPI00286E0392|nr:hypothetical protein [Sulfuricurvum sp.]